MLWKQFVAYLLNYFSVLVNSPVDGLVKCDTVEWRAGAVFLVVLLLLRLLHRVLSPKFVVVVAFLLLFGGWLSCNIE